MASAAELLRKQFYEDPEMLKIRAKGWGNYALNNPEHPDKPGSEPNTKMVWHPELKKYVKAHKAYNFMPNVGNWLRAKETNRKIASASRRRSRNARRSSSRQRSSSRRRSSSKRRSVSRNSTRRKH